MYAPSARGGHAAYTHELLSALAAPDMTGDVSVGLVTSEDLEPQFDSGDYPIYRVLPVQRSREVLASKAYWVLSRVIHYLRREASFVRWARRARPAVIHLQETTPLLGELSVRALRRRGATVVCTVHNLHRHRYPTPWARRLVDMFDVRCWKACDALIAHTDGLAAALADHVRRARPIVCTVPHGLWSGGAPASLEAEHVAARIRNRRLVFFGTLRPNKGLDVLLEAMVSLPRYSLSIVGQPVDRSYLETKVRPLVQRLLDLGIAVTLSERFVPADEVASELAGASAVVLPYRGFESQSGVLFLAAAHGVPVVVTPTGGLGETVSAHGLGTVANGHDAEAVTAAIRALDSLDTEAFVRAVRRLAEESSWQAVARQTVAVYEQAAGRRESSCGG